MRDAVHGNGGDGGGEEHVVLLWDEANARVDAAGEVAVLADEGIKSELLRCEENGGVEQKGVGEANGGGVDEGGELVEEDARGVVARHLQRRRCDEAKKRGVLG